MINRIILFVRLVIHPQKKEKKNPLKVPRNIDLNVIPNISDPFPDLTWRVALVHVVVVRQTKEDFEIALIRG